MQKQHGSANSETKPTERRSEDEDYSPTTTTNSITKMQKEEYLIKNACYSQAKYYLCKQNNKRSLLVRKQRNQVVRSFLNRYQFSCINKITSLFSIRYTLINILQRNSYPFLQPNGIRRGERPLAWKSTTPFCRYCGGEICVLLGFSGHR